MNSKRWPLAPQQEYMVAYLAFRGLDLDFRNPYVALRITGPLDVPRLAGAVDTLARRHAVLRAELDASTSASMRIVDTLGARHFEFDGECPNPEAVMADEERRIFDMTRAPLWRVKLLEVDDNTHVMTVVFCHLISDATMMRTFLDLLSREYADPAGDSPSHQYTEFIAEAGNERRNHGDTGVDRSAVLSRISEVVRWRRAERMEVEFMETRVLPFSIGRDDMSQLRSASLSEGTTPFYATLQIYLEVAAEIFGRSHIVPAFLTSRTDLRPHDDCLGLFSEFTVGLFGSVPTRTNRADSGRSRSHSELHILRPVPSWSELASTVGSVTFPQEIYDVWVRGPVAIDTPGSMVSFPGTDVTVLPESSPARTIPIHSEQHRRVFGGQVIPSLIWGSLKSGSGFLRFNAAAVPKRTVRALVDDFISRVRAVGAG